MQTILDTQQVISAGPLLYSVIMINNGLQLAKAATSTAKSLDSLDKNSIDIIIKDSLEKISKSEISDKEKYLLSHKINTLREIN